MTPHFWTANSHLHPELPQDFVFPPPPSFHPLRAGSPVDCDGFAAVALQIAYAARSIRPAAPIPPPTHIEMTA
jgi:hypothetical protein